MAEFKLVISNPKNGKSVQREAKEDLARNLIGKRLGDAVSGDEVGMPGYEFKLTGGSDFAGFPMRSDVQGSVRKRILAVGGVGIRKNENWRRIRKSVAGNTVHEKTAQLNLTVTKEGSEAVEWPLSKKEKKDAEKAAAAKPAAQAPVEEKAPEAKQ